MKDNININVVNTIASEAGKIILDVYKNEQFEDIIDFKADNSPLTIADKKSHHYIVKNLENAYPEIPIISEEGKDIPYESRKDWNTFWLVDPLDGTKEFIQQNGQFTVNIALVIDKLPVLGVIYAPDKETLYYAEKEKGAYKKDDTGEITTLKVNHKTQDFVGVRSRSHSAPEEEALFKKYQVNDYISIGSSLKFCMIAEGKADIYYRHNPTMEWDTAAGQAIVEASGGQVFQGTSDQIFSYNKESLRNGSFLCVGFKK